MQTNFIIQFFTPYIQRETTQLAKQLGETLVIQGKNGRFNTPKTCVPFPHAKLRLCNSLRLFANHDPIY